jgi:putative ABC transport system permease protein
MSTIVKTSSGSNDTLYNVVVNQALLQKINVQDPATAIGKHIIINGNWHCTIQGVVQDFQSESKHKKIRPCVLLYRPDIFFTASVKIQPGNMHQTVDRIDKDWSALFPDDLFRYEFLDDRIANMYKQEQKLYTAFKLFSSVAILIGCLGLYGLISFATAQRSKEVGIRKVLGASFPNIVSLFVKEFAGMIVIAFLLAAPIAYYVMHNWLENFAYHIGIGGGIFLVALGVSFFIAAFTISYQAFKAAFANPVTALRSE